MVITPQRSTVIPPARLRRERSKPTLFLPPSLLRRESVRAVEESLPARCPRFAPLLPSLSLPAWPPSLRALFSSAQDCWALCCSCARGYWH